MQATDVLMNEHRVIERVLNSLEIGVNQLESGGQVRPEFFLSATDFIRNFADGCHHAKEEGILFTRMTDQGFTLQGCPLGVMLAEHECGRQYNQALTKAAEDMQKGDLTGVQRAIQSSRSYIALLRQHIYKEDHILFPMAAQVIPLETHASLWEQFEQVERAEVGEGVHEKYLALAKVLENEITNFH